MQEASSASKVVMMNLVRVVRDGKADDHCDVVEVLTLDGKVKYVETKEFAKV